MAGGADQAAAVRRWQRRLADERLEARAYRDLAARRSGEEREILLALAEAEARHAAHWKLLLGEHAGTPGRASLRSRVLAMLAHRFGSVFVLALAQRAESRPGAASHGRHRGLLSGGPPLRRALRQLGVGAGAATATYALGLLFGATVG